MSIYNYRRIYEQHYGPIPRDSTGRKYDIHHIDNNHKNNDTSNLKAVTIQEHYDIHYAQGDFGACFMIAQRMKLSADQISMLSSLNNRKRVADGTHHFLGGAITQEYNRGKVADGTHHFLGGAIQRNRVKDGTHNLLGVHYNTARVNNGTHHFMTEHTCPHCGKVGKGPQMKRYHFDNCKIK